MFGLSFHCQQICFNYLIYGRTQFFSCSCLQVVACFSLEAKLQKLFRVNFYSRAFILGPVEVLEEEVEVNCPGWLILQELLVESHSGSHLLSLSFLRPPWGSLVSWSLVVFFLSHFCSSEFFTLLRLFAATCHYLSGHYSTFLCLLTFLSVRFPSSCFLSPHPPVCPSTLRPPLLPCRPPSHRLERESIRSLHACFLLPLPSSAAGDSGTSVRLVRLLFALWGVFWNSSLHSPGRHITPLCVPAYVSVFRECSDAPQACEFVHSLCTFLTPCVHMRLCACVLLLSSSAQECVYTSELSAFGMSVAPCSIYQKLSSNEVKAYLHSCFLRQQTLKGNQRFFFYKTILRTKEGNESSLTNRGKNNHVLTLLKPARGSSTQFHPFEIL